MTVRSCSREHPRPASAAFYFKVKIEKIFNEKHHGNRKTTYVTVLVTVYVTIMVWITVYNHDHDQVPSMVTSR